MIEQGRAKLLHAEREVILAAGAIGTPKLMLLSGLGPADELREVGVDVVADLPEVGRNLHDHFGIDIVYELSGPYSLDKYAKPHWMAWAALEYLMFGRGPIASNIVEGGAFWYADRSSPTPDLQFHFLIGAGVEAGVPKIILRLGGDGQFLHFAATRARIGEIAQPGHRRAANRRSQFPQRSLRSEDFDRGRENQPRNPQSIRDGALRAQGAFSGTKH